MLNTCVGGAVYIRGSLCMHLWITVYIHSWITEIYIRGAHCSATRNSRFWIGQTVAPARKLTKQFAEDSMLILVGKWVVDVRWFKVCMSFLDEI
jgi:hypothetical protein